MTHNQYPVLPPEVPREEALRAMTEKVHNHTSEVDTNQAIYSANEIGIYSNDGYSHKVVAEIALPGVENDSSPDNGRFALVKTHSEGNDGTDYFLVGLVKDAAGLKPARGVRIGSEGVRIGRGREALPASAIWGEGAKYLLTASRNHFGVRVAGNGNLLVEDHSSNGTYLTAHRAEKSNASETQEDNPTHTMPEHKNAENEEVVRGAGHTALAGAALDEQEFASDSAEGKVPESDTVLQELYEEWDFPEGVDVEHVSKKLHEELSVIDSIKTRAYVLSENMQRLHDDLARVMSGNASYATIGPEDIRTMGDQVMELESLLQQIEPSSAYVPRSLSAIPNNLRIIADEARQTMARTSQYFYGENGEDVNSLRAHVEQTLANVTQIPRHMLPLEQAIGEMAQHVGTKVEEKKASLETYADEVITEIAHALKKEAATDQSVENAVLRLERRLDQVIDSEFIDAPGRVRDNIQKSRNAAGHTEKGYNTNARRYAAEIAADILTEKFKPELTTADPIDVKRQPDGTVKVLRGEHRAAACMLLYGSDWLQKAQELGMDVQIK